MANSSGTNPDSRKAGSEEAEIRRHLAAGNALTANAKAIAALEGGRDTREIRYLYLRSLAETGSTRLALRRFDYLAPPAAERDEAWLSLPARLHKDLAFAGEDTAANLDLAAAEYECVYALTGGAFPGVNAATLNLLAGRQDTARQLAREVLERSDGAPAADEAARYAWHTTRAEARLILGDLAACRASLREADPLCRDDLPIRSRTRRQLSRVLGHLGLAHDLAELIALPYAHVVDFTTAGPVEAPPLPGELRPQLDGSPVFCRLTAEPAALSIAEALLDAGARLHLVTADAPQPLLERLQPAPAARARRLLQQAELVTPIRGFLASEPQWRLHQQQRQVQGLAGITAGRFASGLRALTLEDGGWQVHERPEPPTHFQPSRHRRMVGLVFSDMVGFARLKDAEIEQYWTRVVPALADTLRRFDPGILLCRTWGDAIHVVTGDAATAADICLALLETVRQQRERLDGQLAQLELRIGAHFAPAYCNVDALEGRGTFFGSQLAFAARVEPVTPPGTTFISEALCAELELEAPGRFRVEYVGEIALAKRYGSFRLYNLVARRAA